MKKIWFWAMPVLLSVCFMIYGCGCNSTIIRFDCEPTINLVLNSLNDETSWAKLVSNVSLDEIELTYNKSIISYDVTTGQIKAVGQGQTFLKAKADGVEAKVEINVTKNNFVTSFSIKQSDYYVIRNLDDAPFDLLTALKSVYPSLNKYNMGYTFSTTGDLLTIDEKTGEITPLGEGEQEVEIKVVKGISNGEYYYDTQRVTIKVKKPCSTVSISIWEWDGSQHNQVAFTEKNDISTYILEKDKWYVLATETDGDFSGLNNVFTNIFTDEINKSLSPSACVEFITVEDNLAVLNTKNIIRSAFKAQSSFYWQRLYEDPAQNCNQLILSNLMKVIFTDSTTPITCDFDTNKPEPFIIGNEGEEVLLCEGELENASFSFNVNFDNLDEIEVTCDPNANVNFDLNTRKVTVTPTEFNELYTVTVRNKNSTNESQIFFYKFRVIKKFDGNFVTIENNSTNELTLNENASVKFALLEKYKSGYAYEMKVYLSKADDAEPMTQSEINEVFDYSLTPTEDKIVVNINLRNQQAEEEGPISIAAHEDVYYIRFVAKRVEGENVIYIEKLCSALITLNIIEGEGNE